MSDDRRHDEALGMLGRDPSVASWWCLAPCPLPFFDDAEVSLVIDDESAEWPLDAGFGRAVPALLALGPARRAVTRRSASPRTLITPHGWPLASANRWP